MGESSQKIPETVAGTEKVVRGLFHPKFVKQKDGKYILTASAFRPPPEKDEVSVLRLLYTTTAFCKMHFKKISQPAFQKEYFGIAVLDAAAVYASGAHFDNSATDELPMHTNIKYGILLRKNEEMPPQVRLMIDSMIMNARIYKDNNPHSDKWEGRALT